MKNFHLFGKYVFLTFCCAIIASSCAAPTTVSDDPKPIGINGTWHWMESAGGFSGNVRYTPETEGYKQKIVLFKDSLLHTYRNDTLVEAAKYSVIFNQNCLPIKDSCLLLDITDIKTFSNLPYRFLRPPCEGVLRGDSLFLFDNCNDCLLHIYIR